MERKSQTSGDARQSRQQARQQAIAEAVMSEGAIRIETLAERFDISVMTAHRDLDELESQGLLRKSRGVATAMATSLIESSDVYRSGRQLEEKQAIAAAAAEFIEPGQSVIVDDSTTASHVLPHLRGRKPLTVITNTLPVMNEVRTMPGISLIGVGGQYYNWCSAFLGHTATEAFTQLRADVLVMSTSAIIDDMAFHQRLETVDAKRAMFASATTRLLLADHTKFDQRAVHAMAALSDFDAVIVDWRTDAAHVARLRQAGVTVIVANRISQRSIHAS